MTEGSSLEHILDPLTENRKHHQPYYYKKRISDSSFSINKSNSRNISRPNIIKPRNMYSIRPMLEKKQRPLAFSWPMQTPKISSNVSTRHEQYQSFNSSKVISFHSSSKWKMHFEASKRTNKLMVVYFTASWCGPCRLMEPVINNYSNQYTSVEFIKIDVDELMGVSEAFGVQTMPTFLLIKRGDVVDKVVGAKKEDLQMKIEKHRN